MEKHLSVNCVQYKLKMEYPGTDAGYPVRIWRPSTAAMALPTLVHILKLLPTDTNLLNIL